MQPPAPQGSKGQYADATGPTLRCSTARRRGAPVSSFANPLKSPKSGVRFSPVSSPRHAATPTYSKLARAVSVASSAAALEAELEASTAKDSEQQELLSRGYLVGLALEQKGHLFVSAVTCVLCTASTLTSPVLAGYIFEILAGRQAQSLFAPVLVLLGFLYVVEPILTQVYIRNTVAAGEKVLAHVRSDVFRTLLTQKIEFYDKHPASELTQLVSMELDTLRNFVFGNTSRDRGARALLETSGCVVVLAALSWRLGPILAMVIIGTALCVTVYKNAVKTVEGQNAAAQRGMSRVAAECFSNIRTVRSFAGEGTEHALFDQQVEKSFKSGLQFAGAKAVLEAGNRSCIHFSLLVLYSYGGYLVNVGLMPLRTLLAGIGYTFSLVFSTQGIASTLGDFRRASAALQRIRAVLRMCEPDAAVARSLPRLRRTVDGLPPSASTDAEDESEAVAAVAEGRQLRLEDVWFAYPERPNVEVLRGLTLSLPHGTTTALVGHSGAGKSTVAQLLSRFYAPQSGSICLGQQNIGEFSQTQWTRTVALVSQEPVLFSGSIADNIAYGAVGATASREAVEAAAKAANAHDFVSELPEGYDTMVGERGALLSGGQRQRIAIARALLKDAPVIILDEATSALDARSEMAVQEALERLVMGRTVLVIAHRLSTVQRANQIAVIDDGVVAERGTHEELIAARGMYASLVGSSDLQG